MEPASKHLAQDLDSLQIEDDAKQKAVKLSLQSTAVAVRKPDAIDFFKFKLTKEYIDEVLTNQADGALQVTLTQMSYDEKASSQV